MVDAEKQHWPVGTSEMAMRIRAHDWSATPLGPADSWPQSLKTAVDIVLASNFPMAALWGPRLVRVYNDGYRDLMGAGHPGGLGQASRRSPGPWDAAEAVVERALAGETLEHAAAHHVPARNGGSAGAWYTLSYSPLRDEASRVAGVLVTAVETTEQVRTEAELRKREERFRALVTASSYVVYRMSPDWTVMRELDGAGFLSTTEHATDEWVGQYIHPDDEPLVMAAIGEAVRTKSMFELEHRVRRADGTLGWTLSRAVPLLDSTGEITEWVGAASDVTARRKAEKELAETRRRLDAALIAGEVGTFEWDVAGDRLWGDQNFARIFGIRLDGGAAPLADYVAAIHPDDRDDVLKRVSATVEKGSDYEAEYRIAGAGETRWIIARGKGERDASGRVVRFPGVVLDVTEQKRAEAELRRSNSLLHAISDSTEDAIFAKDREGRLTFANPATLALIGKPLERVLGRTDAEILDDKEAAREVMRNDQRIMAGGVAEDLEEMVPLPDGTRRVWFSRKMPYRDARGDVVGLLGVSRDITARKVAEEAVRASEARKAFLLELSDRLRPLVDPAEIQYEAARTLGERLKVDRAGYAEDQGDGATIAVTRSYTDGAPGLEGVYRYDDYGRGLLREMRAGRTVVRPDIAADPILTDAEKHAHAVLRIGATVDVPLVKEGRLVAVLFVHSTGARAWTGDEVALMEETAERTWAAVERARSEEALRASEARLQKAISIETVGVLFFNLDGRITDVNAAFTRMTGYGRDELLGSVGWEELTPPEFMAATARAAGELARKGETAPYEKQMVRKDGSRWWGLFAPTRLTGSGQESRCVEFVVDITEQKRAEAERERLLARESELRAQAEAANTAKDEFLATVSHELRTPLNAILGWSTMLRSGSLDEAAAAQALATIERNVRVQAQIIEDLLDVSRIVSGKLRLDVRLLDPREVVSAAADAARPAAHAKGVRLRTTFETAAGPVLADPDRLQQVVWNLLSNALKFTPRGGGIELRLGGDEEHVEIAVRDTGQGIAPEFLPYVFDRFRQADGSTTRRHGGLGLGLAIVRQLVELHGGTVAVESEGPDRGATFTIRLPRGGAEAGGGAGEERVVAGPGTAASPDRAARLDGLRVLAVDDEQDSRELLAEVLGRCGADVLAVSSADEALGRIEAFGPDVLVSDLAMPGRDGFELIRAVRALAPARVGRVPAVALTAYARSGDRARALEAGFQKHAAKPIEPSELVSIVAGLAVRG